MTQNASSESQLLVETMGFCIHTFPNSFWGLCRSSEVSFRSFGALLMYFRASFRSCGAAFVAEIL